MNTKNHPPARPSRQRVEKERREEARHHDEAVEDTFPASDPPSTSQPGSGITGAEVLRKPRNRR
jgi:hypothetical protein